MNNFWARTISGAVYVILVIGSLFLGLKAFIPLFTFITAVCLWEFYSQTMSPQSPFRIPGTVAGTLLFVICAFAMLGQKQLLMYLPFLLLTPFVFLIFGLFRPQAPNFRDTGIYVLGFLYIIAPFLCLVSIENTTPAGSGLSPLLGIFILFWVNDTGAYLSGRAFGKTKLFPVVSPKKTVEGLAGGVALCLAASWLLSRHSLSLSLTDWLITGTLVAVLGTLGDLVESMWKRQLEIKDSGNIMPGHGGLMDRFDGFFIAIPFIFSDLIFMR